MAISNKERVGRSLDLVKEGLYPFIEREMLSVYGQYWLREAESELHEDRNINRSVKQRLVDDVCDQFNLIFGKWQPVFKKTLGNAERSLVGELKAIRNDWAHGATFSTDDAYRTLDSSYRLLSAISAPQAAVVDKQRQELLRLRFEEQARRETRKAAASAIESHPQGGLKPWREIATPHPDVASGRYQQAEFAADLWQVYLDDRNCANEYRDPTEFFSRTYLTEGLKQLLTNALRRLSGQSADPVIELQTNFGGGKTHAMLALYHLCLGVRAQDLPGTESIFREAEVSDPPQEVRTAVVVGNKISPGQIHHKKDGTAIRTLWGEIAWQLGGKEGYEMVKEADETSTNPGDRLKELFNRYSPCLILVDEWVAYARQLHVDKDLPAGDFDTHFTFAQTLSESAKNADRTLLVVSIPESNIEIGGDRGIEALNRLKNAIGRVESPWRPASADESFQIVRRRLFQDISDPQLFIERDAVIKAFSELYRSQSQEFPLECRETDYERRLADAYPIHPELFDRLYSDWSSIDKFQRTRGVLRFMAKVIHHLWEAEDRSLAILPASVPMADPQVQSELTRYLEDYWLPVIDKDVDGVNSLPLVIDRQNPNLGRYSACRRVTRTIYLGSAPVQQAANRGLEDRRIKLGCIQPGETAATFGDALRRLTDQSTYLYVDRDRYWISTQPNVTRAAQDRASQYERDEDGIWEEVVRRLKKERDRGEFMAVHIAPNSSTDIPDDESLGARLVILAPTASHSKNDRESLARAQASEMLNSKGTSPRYGKNSLIFLAADRTKLTNLKQWVCQYLAWNSILSDKDELNLDVFQGKQAIAKQKDADSTVSMLVNDTYQWLLIPTQADPQAAIEWDEIRLQNQDSPIVQASRKLVSEEYLILDYAASRLSMEVLNPYIWKGSDRIDIKTLWKYFSNYLYLPRLRNSDVLLKAIADGVRSTAWSQDFAYATGWDEIKQKYMGLKVAEVISPTISQHSLLVKPEAAQRQLDVEREVAEREAKIIEPKPPNAKSVKEKDGDYIDPLPPIVPPPPPLPKAKQRFYGSVEVDALRLNRDSAQISDEVLQHLTKLLGAKVQVTLEIEVTVPDGIPDDTIRTVMENCRTLKFKSFNFEEDY